MSLKSMLCALGLVVAGASAANATVITKHWAFEAQTTGPISSHEGYFSYQYDTVTQETNLTAVDFALGDYVFTVDDVLISLQSDLLILGGKIGLINSMPHGTNDFYLVFLTDMSFSTFSYTQEGWSGIGTGSVVVTELAGPPVTAAPEPVDVAEPGTLGLIGAGLIGAALATGRRRRAAA